MCTTSASTALALRWCLPCLCALQSPPSCCAAHLTARTLLQDPRNNMPSEPNQQPFPGQRKPISTSREQSNIPKGGTDATWVYPSPQMFYNGAHAHGLAIRALRLLCLTQGKW